MELGIYEIPEHLLMKHQASLGLSWQQLGFIRACFIYKTVSPASLESHTGLAASTIKGIRKQLLNIGFLTKEYSFEPLVDKLVDLECKIDIYDGQTLAYDTLSVYEKVMVLDNFTCRICNENRWEEGTSLKFNIRRVVESGEMFISRIVVCNKCEWKNLSKAKTEMLQKSFTTRLETRIPLYEGNHLSAEEDRIIRASRDRKNSQNGGTESVPTNKPELVTTNADSESPPYVPPSSINTKKLFKSNSIEVSGSVKTQNQASGASPPPLLVMKKKGIAASEDDESATPLEKSSSPGKQKSNRKPTKATKQAELGKKRFENRLKSMRETAIQDWTLDNCMMYFIVKRNEEFGFFADKENIAENNKHLKVLINTTGGPKEFKAFIDWVMDYWNEFWFNDDKAPRLRTIKGNLDDVYGRFKAGKIIDGKLSGPQAPKESLGGSNAVSDVYLKHGSEKVPEHLRMPDDADPIKKLFGDDK